MATWGPIQLRLKGSRQVEFDGEASPAPGDGSMPGGVVITPVTILYSDMVDTGNGYRFAPIVDLVVGDVLEWVVAFVSVAFNDSNAGTSNGQVVDALNTVAMGIFQFDTLDTPVLASGLGFLNLDFGASPSNGGSAPFEALSLSPILAQGPLSIGVTDNGGLAGDGTAGTVRALYAKAST